MDGPRDENGNRIKNCHGHARHNRVAKRRAIAQQHIDESTCGVLAIAVGALGAVIGGWL